MRSIIFNVYQYSVTITVLTKTDEDRYELHVIKVGHMLGAYEQEHGKHSNLPAIWENALAKRLAICLPHIFLYLPLGSVNSPVANGRSYFRRPGEEPKHNCPSGTAVPRPNCYRNPQTDFGNGTWGCIDNRRNTIDRDHLYHEYYMHRPSHIFDLATVIIFNRRSL